MAGAGGPSDLRARRQAEAGVPSIHSAPGSVEEEEGVSAEDWVSAEGTACPEGLKGVEKLSELQRAEHQECLCLLPHPPILTVPSFTLRLLVRVSPARALS